MSNHPLESSSWEVAEILIYNSRLTDGQVENVEGYLKNRYGVAGGGTGTSSSNYRTSSDATLYAQWNSTITYFNSQSGTGTVPVAQSIPQVGAPLSGNTGNLAAPGKTLIGWNTQEMGGTRYRFGETYTPVTGNASLYAQWVDSLTLRNPANGTSTTASIAAGVGGRVETITAANGFGARTFSLSPGRTGFSIDTSTANSAALVVSSLVATGTYLETITVTDAAGFSVSHVVTVTVATSVRFDTSTATSLVTSYGRPISLQLNTIGGFGTRVFTLTAQSNLAITLDTSTAGSGFATLNVAASSKAGTYLIALSVTDSTRIRSNLTVTVTVNPLPTIAFPTGTAPALRTNNLLIHFDIRNALSYAGTGTTVTSLVGNTNATITNSAAYSTQFDGHLNITGGNYIGTNTCLAGIATGAYSNFLWVNPRANGIVLTENNGAWHTSTIEVNNGTFKFRVYNGTILTYTMPSLNRWYYVGLVYDGANEYAYVNGVQVASATVTRSATTVNCLGIGRDDTTNLGIATSGEFLFGALHSYSAALSATDVRNNFEATQRSYLVSTPKSGDLAIETTQGLNTTYSSFVASDGTRIKAFGLAPVVPGITIETGTANSAVLRIGPTAVATSTTAAATYLETLTATDEVGATSKYDLSIRINPPIIITDATPGTLTTTFGRIAYDTFTATQGTGMKTFTGVSSAFPSAFAVTSPSSNVALLTVANTLPAGTYLETITATDAAGATTSFVLTVVVNPGVVVAGLGSNQVATTSGRSTSLRVNVTGGTGARTLATSTLPSGITIDSSTIGSNFATLNVGSSVATNSYNIVITATDSTGATARETITVTVNLLPTISAPATTITTTQGVAATLSGSTASNGTGIKSFTITGSNAGVSIDTSTANAFTLNLASTMSATNSTTARTFTETVTATDSASAIVRQAYTITINPPVIETATSTSIAITSGVETTTVIYATQGTGNKTFALSGASSGFTLTSGTNQATLRVLATANPDTYNLTVTATDAVGATTTLPITVVVSPPPTLVGISRIETTRGVSFTSSQFGLSGGTGSLSVTVTNSPTNSHITLAGTTATGTFLVVAESSTAGTFLSTIRVTDARGSFSELIVTVVVNAPVTLTGALSITKSYGNSTTNGYSTNGTGTAPFSFSATPVCAVVKTVSGNFTYERINGTDSCTWTAPVGITTIDALLVGAGGGGGGDGGAGGGGGSINTLTSVTLPANRQLSVQVGTGGSGGIFQGPNAAAGGATTLTSGATTFTAPGGGAGGGCGSAASSGGSAGTGGSASVGGAGGFGSAGTGCSAGAGSIGANGPASSFTGSAISFGGGGGGGPYPDSTASIGGRVGGAGGGGTGAITAGTPSIGLTQYFRTFGSTPPNANTKPSFISGTCAVTYGNINYTGDSQFPCAQKDNFQSFASGFFVAPHTGDIRFYLDSDDSSHFSITVGGTVREFSADNGGNNANYSGFVKDQMYPISVFFTERGGLASWRLDYEFSGQARTPIPASQLRPSVEGLAQYFRQSGSQPSAASNKTVITSDICGARLGNIDYGSDNDFPCSQKDNFQGYATGFFIAPVTGSIKFYLNSDDSSLMSITVNGTTQEFSTAIGDVSATYSGFVQGQYYPIKVFFTEGPGLAIWKLDYEFAGQSRISIPVSRFRSSADFTAATQGTNGLGGGGGGGTAGFHKLSGAAGGSGTVVLKYLTPSETATQTMITAIVNQQSPSGLLTLNVPAFVNVGTYYETITVQDAANSAPYQSVVTITINKATPTLALALPGSVTTTKYGSAVTISATSPVSGRVAFVNGSDTITACATVLASSGLATCSWTPTVIGATTLRAILTPPDTANYNSSAQVNLAVTVAKADTLTVTVLSQTETFTGSTIVATRAFSTTGLAAIDSLTAISMIFTGTANDGNAYSNTTAPTNAGTYSIRPNFPANAAAFTFGVGSAGTISAITNYESVTVVAGTLTVRRAPQTMVFTYPNSNSVTYSPTATLASTATTRLGEGTRTYSSTTPITCSISETAVVTVLQAGSCSVQMAVALAPNFEADTATRLITINKSSRTFSLTPAVSTLKFADTTTVTATLSGGAADGTISYTLGSPAGCTFDPLSGELLAISGTVQCPLTATISEGINYLAETSTAISLTIARANAPVIIIDTVTALSHTPGIRALITPTFTVAGLKNTDTADSVTFTYGLVSNPFETFAYSDTRTPIDAGTYSITPSALTLSSGLMSNYETPTYSASAINVTINRISQETVTVENTNSEVDVPFAMYANGGSTLEAFTFNLVSGSFCSIAGSQLSATAAGTCVVTVTRGGNRNYLPVTSVDITMRVRNFIIVVAQVPSNPVTGITIAPSTPPLTKAPDSNACTTGCVPSITSINVLAAAEADLVVITGLSFSQVNKVYFRLDTFSPTDDVEAPNFAVDSDTQISVRVPAGLTPEFYTIRVATPDKTSARFYDIEILP